MKTRKMPQKLVMHQFLIVRNFLTVHFATNNNCSADIYYEDDAQKSNHVFIGNEQHFSNSFENKGL